MNNTTARTPAENLQHVINHWDHLRAALDTNDGPSTSWPPTRPGAAYLRALDTQDAADVTAEQSLVAALAHALDHPQQLVTVRHHTGQLYYECAHCDHVGEGLPHPVREDRDPAQLGERPVPLRLHVVDACRAIEIALCAVADQLAARDTQDGADWYSDPYNPADWTAGRPEGRTALAAARWLLGRLDAGPCCPTHYAEQATIAEYARTAAERIDRVLGTGRVSRVLPSMPCPWCQGELVIHTEAGTVLAVTCATGLVDCNAPAAFDVDRRARVWSTPEQLAGLQRAVDAAERARAGEEEREKRADARRRQRAALREQRAA
ncbi:hypothetical protein GTX53_24315 [Streptomyces sp. SID5594]|uniref:hypothetical protein n=1 Tax=unclassified Streptomyces TaxID=2593676 RepID=UPI00036392B2|nr:MULTISPECIES: hypothetical protein [unclassified Streptomyces]MZF56917.1 hypothetical protein [Streptomyces sp. SID5594]